MAWQKLMGAASDISIGADGSVFVIGSSTKNEAGDYASAKWDAVRKTWVSRGGTDLWGVRIAVQPDGLPWVLKATGEIFRPISDGKWEKLTGAASDISIGANGSVFVIGYPNKVEGNNYAVFRWTGSQWDVVSGIAGVRIAVQPDGLPWVVKATGEIFRTGANNTWHQCPEAATDIAIGADGSVLVTGYGGNDPNFGVYQWNGSIWQYRPEIPHGVRLAVHPNGKIWILQADGGIYVEP